MFFGEGFITLASAKAMKSCLSEKSPQRIEHMMRGMHSTGRFWQLRGCKLLVKFLTSLASRILSHECESQIMSNGCIKGRGIQASGQDAEVCLKSWRNAAKVLINSSSWTLATKDSIDEIITSYFTISCISMRLDTSPQSNTVPRGAAAL